ncbi:MAG TPA: GIDE domain-containing protein [Terriglobia bacterium]|nr:GIDE domain-containing protein [Terriglobia bacterium]
MIRRHFRSLVLGFALVSMFAVLLLRAQTSKRPQSYSLTMVASMPQASTAKLYRQGSKERIDLTVAAGPDSPEEVHQILLFDSQAHKAYAQDPASHACYWTQYASEDALGNYDPFMMAAQAGGSLDKMIPGGKLVGTQTINGLTAKLYAAGTEKLWWSDVYDLPIKMEMIEQNIPPIVMMEIKRLVTTAPPASFFMAPSGCTETQGKWTGAGFEASGQSTVTLGAVAPQTSPWVAPPSFPTHYTLVNVTNLTEASLFTGQPSTLKIYRNGSKERIDLRIAPWAANRDGLRNRFLFDFSAHKAYTTAWNGNVVSCSWIKYVSADAPGNYDPITGTASMMTGLGKEGTPKDLGPQTLNGIPAKGEETMIEGVLPVKVWIAQKGGFLVKYSAPMPGGKGTAGFEVKQVSLAPPPASVFATPTGCSETQGEWSDTGLNASTSETVTVGTPSSQPSGAASGTQETSASKRIAAETGGSAGDFVNAIYPPGTPSTASCTVLFRVVHAGTMEPITTGYGTGLDLDQNFSGSKYSIKEDMQGRVSFSGGTIRDVTSQFQNGTLRIPNAPPHFRLDVEFGGANGGTGYTGLIYRQCFRPETVLLLVINNTEGSNSGDWLWVKSGKYATIAASQATAAASAPANLVTNGDFESGNTGFTTGYTYGNVSGPGGYWIGANASKAPGAYGDWYNGGDHTTGKGNMFVVDGANSATTPVWEEAVPVTPNTTYTFSYWGAEVDHDSNSLPHLQLKINGSSVGSSVFPENSPDNGGKWENFTFTWNSGSSTSADLALFDLNTDTPWNDFAMDDISFGSGASTTGAVAAGPAKQAPPSTQGGALPGPPPFPKRTVVFHFSHTYSATSTFTFGGKHSIFGLIIGLTLPLLLLYGGFRTYREYRILIDTPVMPVRSIAMGLSHVRGKATGDDRLTSPFTKQPCFYYQVRVERYVPQSKGSNWQNVTTDTERQNFYLDDGTGKVLVNPEKAEFEVARTFSAELGPHVGASRYVDPSLGVSGPSDQELQAYLTVAPKLGGVRILGDGAKSKTLRAIQALEKTGVSLGTGGVTLNFGGQTYRFTEHCLIAERDCNVLGTCTENPAPKDDHDRKVMKRGQNEKTFLITTETETRIEKTLRRRALLLILIGAGILIILAAGLLHQAGML